MRQLNITETERLEYLVELGMEVVLIEPTATGLEKSIMDATKSIRDYLADSGVHDYSTQLQGPEYKVVIPSTFILEGRTVNSKASLYRPVTKSGDPRMWFYGLKELCRPKELLALAVKGGQLVVFNITRLDVRTAAKVSGPFKEFVDSYVSEVNAVSDELLAKIKTLSERGFIKSDIDADTAIGRLLEKELGINANSSRLPDYKGIELKSYREGRNSRMNLFAQVPNWDMSTLKSSKQILETFGYEREGAKKLYCTVSALKPNSQGLSLRVDESTGLMVENSVNPAIGDFVVWETTKLRERLAEKHNETFWVAAEERRVGDDLFFKFTKVEHTRGPILSQLEVLIKNGYINMDHLIKETDSGVREKGPLFKLRKDGLPLLFPPSQEYEL